MIIDIQYLKENLVNEEIFSLCTQEEATLIRYLNIIETKIKSYLDIEQFKQGESYLFPEDLKDTARYLLESLYLNRNLNPSGGKLSSYTEKFDDYSDSKTFDLGEIVYWKGIPVINEYLQILNKYRGNSLIYPSGRFSI